MKYGIVKHIGFAKENDTQNRLVSLGDIFECLAIKKIYEKMQVEFDDLIICHQNNLDSYLGEYVVLPINIYSLNVNYSDRILPVFLGLSIGGIHSLSDRSINILRRFQPVGCRDERTMRLLIDKYGINAYLQGCLVATFPERKIQPETQNTVFFVDPHAGIKDYIPNSLFENYEFFSHDFYIDSEKKLSENGIFDYGEKIIQKYSTEAKLIVTSKYHAAIIALALGIPVILVMENNYFKYSWINKFIPVYEPKDFDKIDWNPQKVVIPQYQKDMMINIAIKRLKQTHDDYYDICSLSELRESPDIPEFEDIFYGASAIEWIKRNWSKSENIKYAFWGATDTSKKIFEFIQCNYPNANLEFLFDYSIKVPVKYGDEEYMPILPEHLAESNYNDIFVIVAGNSASLAAKELFEKTNRTNYLLCERKVLTEKDINNE